MAEAPKASCRLAPINHAYLEDLAKVGPYGKNKSAVMQRFIEDGIRVALEKQVITKRNIDEFGGVAADEE